MQGCVERGCAAKFWVCMAAWPSIEWQYKLPIQEKAYACHLMLRHAAMQTQYFEVQPLGNAQVAYQVHLACSAQESLHSLAHMQKLQHVSDAGHKKA